MIESLVLDLVDKNVMTNQIVLTVSYDIDNLTDPNISKWYKGEITVDYYGRKAPKHAHGSVTFEKYTSSSKKIIDATMKLYDEIVNKDLLVRRINIGAGRLLSEEDAKKQSAMEQLSFFSDYTEKEKEQEREEKERNMQKAVLDIKKKFGKNALLKGVNFVDGATARDRNEQIGGHKA
jgi:DNA polymerase V